MADEKQDSHLYTQSSHLENMTLDQDPPVGDLKSGSEAQDVNNPQVMQPQVSLCTMPRWNHGYADEFDRTGRYERNFPLT